MPLPNWATPALAFDLVAQLISRKDVCELHGITVTDLKPILRSAQFRQMLLDAKQQWDAPSAADERIRVKARMAQESALEDMHDIARSNTSADSDRIAAYKSIMASAEIPGSGRSAMFGGGGASGGGLNITINLAGDKQPAITLEAAPAEDAAALTAE